jgi:hypothetical protein
MIKSRKRCAHKVETRNTYKILVGKLLEMRPIGNLHTYSRIILKLPVKI